MASLQHVLLQDWGVLGEVPPLLRLRTQSTSSPESWVTSSGRNPQWSPCQEQGAGARRKGWRCGQSGRTGGTATGGTTRCPGLQLRPCFHGSGHVLRVPCSVLPHLPQVGPSSPAGPGAHCEPTNGIHCQSAEHSHGDTWTLAVPRPESPGPRPPLSISPRHWRQVGSCSPKDVPRS